MNMQNGTSIFNSNQTFFLTNVSSFDGSNTTFNLSFTNDSSSSPISSGFFAGQSNATMTIPSPKKYMYLTHSIKASHYSHTYTSGKIIITLFGSATF